MCRKQCIIVSAESVVKVAKVKSVRLRVCRVVLLQFLGRVFCHKNYVPVRVRRHEVERPLASFIVPIVISPTK